MKKFGRILANDGLLYEPFGSGYEINSRFPGLRLSDDYAGVMDPNGGILRVDRCLKAFWVRSSSEIVESPPKFF